MLRILFLIDVASTKYLDEIKQTHTNTLREIMFYLPNILKFISTGILRTLFPIFILCFSVRSTHHLVLIKQTLTSSLTEIKFFNTLVFRNYRILKILFPICVLEEKKCPDFTVNENEITKTSYDIEEYISNRYLAKYGLKTYFI